MTRDHFRVSALTLVALTCGCATTESSHAHVTVGVLRSVREAEDVYTLCQCERSASLRERSECLYLRGVDLDADSHFVEAQRCFDESAAISHAPPGVLGQVTARVHEGDLLGAHRILVASPQEVQNQLEQSDHDLIHNLRSHFAMLEVVPDGPVPSDVSITLDARAFSLDEEHNELTPGPHVLTVSGVRRDTRVYRLNLLGGEAHRQAVEIGPQHAAPVYKSPWFWLGVTISIVGGAALFDCLETRVVLCQPIPVVNGSGVPSI